MYIAFRIFALFVCSKLLQRSVYNDNIKCRLKSRILESSFCFCFYFCFFIIARMIRLDDSGHAVRRRSHRFNSTVRCEHPLTFSCHCIRCTQCNGNFVLLTATCTGFERFKARSLPHLGRLFLYRSQCCHICSVRHICFIFG